jgi:hypothetical protein
MTATKNIEIKLSEVDEVIAKALELGPPGGTDLLEQCVACIGEKLQALASATSAMKAAMDREL